MTNPGNHIGTLIKPRGYKGEMLLKGKPQFLEELEPGTPLFIEIDKQRVPFFIEELSIDYSGEKCILKMEFINSDIVAKKYVNCQVYEDVKSNSKASKSDKRKEKNINETSDKLSLHIAEYVGFTVKDENSGIELEVINYIDNPYNPLLILQLNKEEIMLPLNADYIINTNTKNLTIKVNFPDGLLNL